MGEKLLGAGATDAGPASVLQIVSSGNCSQSCMRSALLLTLRRLSHNEDEDATDTAVCQHLPPPDISRRKIPSPISVVVINVNIGYYHYQQNSTFSNYLLS